MLIPLGLSGREVRVFDRLGGGEERDLVEEGNEGRGLPLTLLAVAVHLKECGVAVDERRLDLGHERAEGLWQEELRLWRQDGKELDQGSQRGTLVKLDVQRLEVREVGHEGGVKVGVKPGPRAAAVVVVAEAPLEAVHVVTHSGRARVHVRQRDAELVAVIGRAVVLGVVYPGLLLGAHLEVGLLIHADLAQVGLEAAHVELGPVCEEAAHGRQHAVVHVEHHVEGALGHVEVGQAGQEVVAHEHAYEHEVVHKAPVVHGEVHLGLEGLGQRERPPQH
mmetsp:Transcript_27839/g.75006  ORF Transcript_27839/g.75006 Transcript_27839/m.75006 type:complete len:278 (-) Transcript_27839:998-1831(-)